MEIGTSDLQQCADAVMRLRAEYLWHEKKYEEIHFNFTNGMRVDYSKWAQGYRIKVNGNNTSWYKATGEDYSYQTFRKYMNQIFMYAGTASLSKELKSISLSDLQVGDVFIIGGHPGHAMIVVDMAEDYMGNKAILVAQSYMPAQDIHIVTNLKDKAKSPWYIINRTTKEFNFPEYHFNSSQIMRFQ
jgi:secreted PhoX family phosphatase